MPKKHFEVLSANADQLQAKNFAPTLRDNTSSDAMEVRTGTQEELKSSGSGSNNGRERTSSYSAAL